MEVDKAGCAQSAVVGDSELAEELDLTCGIEEGDLPTELELPDLSRQVHPLDHQLEDGALGLRNLAAQSRNLRLDRDCVVFS